MLEMSTYGNASIAVIVRLHADANFPGGGQRWSHVILGKLEWGDVYPRIIGMGVPKFGGADFFVTPAAISSVDEATKPTHTLYN